MHLETTILLDNEGRTTVQSYHRRSPRNKCFIFGDKTLVMHLTYFIFILLRTATASGSLFSFDSLIRIKNGTSKLWFQYIEEFISQISAVPEMQCRLNILRILSHQLEKASSFKKFSVQLAHKLAVLKVNPVTDEVVTETFMTFTRASGKIEHEDFKGDHLRGPEIIHIKESKLVCLFHLNRNLAINLTFHSLTFSRVHCNAAIVTITNMENRRHSFKFCGQHSNFMLYSPFSNINMTVAIVTSSLFKVYCKVIALFQMMTGGLIKTIVHQHVDTSFLGLKNISVLKIEKVSLMSVSFIETNKTQYLVLKRPVWLFQQLSIFDGPGYLSPKMTFNKNKLVMSSF